MKRTVLPTVLFLLLTACSGATGIKETACDQLFWDGTVGTCLPKGWHVVDRGGLDERGAPPEVLVAFQADNPVSGQFPTVTVTREVLTQKLTSSAYSDASVHSVEKLPEYQHVESKEVSIDGETLQMHTFTAQPRSDQPKARFFQVSMALNDIGYTFTGAVPLSVESAIENQIKLMLTNATLKEQVQ